MKLPEITRRITRPVRVGSVTIGGVSEAGTPNPVVLQSMTNTQTADAEATLAQIRDLAAAGAELVRVAIPKEQDTEALRNIVAESPVPIIADVHFHFQRAIEAIAAGVAKIRLNPGNISDADQVRRVIDAAGEAGVAIRVGVNEGSIVDRRDGRRHTEQLSGALDELMLEKLAEYLGVFEKAGFANLVLSAKSHDAVTNIAVNRAIAKRWDYPLHLGVTHAGTAKTGTMRTAAALGTLLSDGIGETIRVSFSGDPVREIHAAKELLASLRLRRRDGVELISCPTCGRLQMDLNPIIEKVSEALKEFEHLRRPIQVAIMGCVVNGPGEADNADVAICAGKDKAVLYCHGQRLRNVTPAEIVPAVLEEVRALATEE
ncbi:MAG: flavodoxin-dependent (E)-4-hydroxy-3-methylbut-2-enyl-diphosphate synthase [Phycisphaerae bacterium]|nr:flavodoxin-dependent (E)-4-hydroxy-3-methylbut-2-enyl-diphosphate synthase [Phycisphaerae bacterium]